MKTPHLICKKLKQHSNIQHGFFGRKGGVSDGIYTSLNCGYGSHDSHENVTQNRQLVAREFSIIEHSLITINQIHSNKTLTLYNNTSRDTLSDGDALATSQAGLALAIQTADCVPVLFSDAKNRVIGAAHAGWKGAISGVTDNTISAMEKLGAEASEITASIGPCIAQPSYEISQEFYDTFIADDAANATFFKDGKAGHYYFDIKSYVAARLAASGIKTISVLGNDTCAEEEFFFSNRRRNLRGEPDYGRQLSVIMLKDS